METFELKDHINVFCIQAITFPEGVQVAHQTLHSLVPFSKERKYFGISYPDASGSIVYKAAVSELKPGELRRLPLEEFVIVKGAYISITILNFMDNIPKIGEAFKKLIGHPHIDPKGACIEWYLDDQDCKCLVKLE